MNSHIAIRENDRRVHPRIACAIQAETDNGILCEILDLSTGGALLALPDMPSTEQLSLSFSLVDPDGHEADGRERRLHLMGRVRRAVRLPNRGHGIGIEFINASTADRELLNRYVLRHVINDIIEVVERQTMDLDPADIKDFGPVFDQLDAMFRESVELSICQRDVAEILTARIVRVDRAGQGQVELELVTAPAQVLTAGLRVHVNAARSHHYHFFYANIQSLQGTRILISPPPTIFSYDMRKSQRQPASSALKIEIPLPWPAGASLTRQLIDISADGMAFKTPANETYFLPGTPLREIRIIGPGDGPVTTRSGQVMHVTALEEPGRPVQFLKVGVEFGITDNALTRGRRPNAPPTKETSFLSRMAQLVKHLTTRTFSSTKAGGPSFHFNPVDVVRYVNGRKEEIVAILNTTSRDDQRLHAPLVIIPPAHGKRKESTYALALTLIENFRRRKKDLVVLRYDGIRTLGESFRDPDCRTPGNEGLHWTFSQSVEDLKATLDFAYDNPRFFPTEVVVISPSVQAVPTRKVLVQDAGRRVHYWISLMGVPAAQEVIRNGTGGIDYLANYARGISPGRRQILGIMMDADRFCADTIHNGMAFIGDSIREMSQIPIPITWLYGKYDAWIDPLSVREVMEAPASAAREVIEVPVGHIPLNGEEAIECFYEVIRHMWRFLYGDEVDPVPPNLDELKRTRQLEWARTPRQRLNDRQDYWKKYLMGDGPSTACYDVFEFFDEYRAFLKQQIELLDLKPGQVFADMGTGIGHLPAYMLERYGGRKAWKLGKIVITDLVPEALVKAKARLEKVAKRAGQPLPPLEVATLNLQLSPVRTLKRFLAGEFFGYDPLKGLIQGLSDYSVEAWKRLADWRLHGLLRGRPLTDDDRAFLDATLPPVEQQVLLDFNRLMRFVAGGSLPEDFVDPRSNPRTSISTSSTDRLKQLRLEVLKPWTTERVIDRLPFEDATFDRIACTLVLSYLENPAETLADFVRCLKPGGRIVFSSMMPDVDPSRIYMKALRKLETGRDVELPEGFTRESLAESIRAHINSGAGLLQMAEEMQFTFFSKEELRQLAERAGLSRVEIFPAYGEKPQAYISVGYKV